MDLHQNENNDESQKHLNKNRKGFSRQLRQVFDLLMKGETLTVLDAIVKHGIGHLPVRIFELKKVNGFHVTDVWENNKKRWMMTPADVAANKALQNANPDLQ